MSSDVLSLAELEHVLAAAATGLDEDLRRRWDEYACSPARLQYRWHSGVRSAVKPIWAVGRAGQRLLGYDEVEEEYGTAASARTYPSRCGARTASAWNWRFGSSPSRCRTECGSATPNCWPNESLLMRSWGRHSGARWELDRSSDCALGMARSRTLALDGST